MNKKAIEKINNVLPRKINILDIGSRGGLSGWLKEIEKSCEVYPFDADPQLSKRITLACQMSYRIKNFINVKI